MSAAELELQALQFIETVVGIRPAVAVFDCDGTLWSGDAGADFFYWEMDHGLLSEDRCRWGRARYQEYLDGEVSEEQMCGEMVTINRGVSCEALRNAARDFFHEQVSHRIFPEMQELVRRLEAQAVELWAVSSTNDWVVQAGAERFGIPRDHILAACAREEEGCVSDCLIRVPTDELKVTAIREVIGKEVDAVFGNSIHDLAMLDMVKHPFCINPNPDLEAVARARGWPVYWPVRTAA